MENGANVNAPDSSGETPLHFGIGDETTVRILLEFGANFFDTGTWYRNLWTAATDCENTSVLHFVLEQIRGDRQTSREDKRNVLVQALGSARGAVNLAAVDLLLQKLSLYSDDYDPDERIREFVFK